MFNFFKNRNGRRFVDLHTTTRLTDEESMEENSKDFIQPISKQFLIKNQLIELCSARIAKNVSFMTKLNVYTSILALVLCSAILGVQLEVSLLGFKLSEIVRLKEFVLVVLMTSSILYQFRFSENQYLEGLRKQIEIKIYGEHNAKFHQLLHPRYMETFFSFSKLDSSQFSLPLRAVLFRVPIFVGWLVVFVVAIAGILVLHAIIAFDIWINSNLSSPWNKILVVSYIIAELSNIYFWIVGQTVRSKYTDKEKFNAFDKMTKNKEQYEAAIRDYLLKS